MRQLIALFVVAFSLVLGGGCSGEKAPKADPNFKSTSNPGDITIPSQMQDGTRGKRRLRQKLKK